MYDNPYVGIRLAMQAQEEYLRQNNIGQPKQTYDPSDPLELGTKREEQSIVLPIEEILQRTLGVKGLNLGFEQYSSQTAIKCLLEENPDLEPGLHEIGLTDDATHHPATILSIVDLKYPNDPFIPRDPSISIGKIVLSKNGLVQADFHPNKEVTIADDVTAVIKEELLPAVKESYVSGKRYEEIKEDVEASDITTRQTRQFSLRRTLDTILSFVTQEKGNSREVILLPVPGSEKNSKKTMKYDFTFSETSQFQTSVSNMLETLEDGSSRKVFVDMSQEDKNGFHPAATLVTGKDILNYINSDKKDDLFIRSIADLTLLRYKQEGYISLNASDRDILGHESINPDDIFVIAACYKNEGDKNMLLAHHSLRLARQPYIHNRIDLPKLLNNDRYLSFISNFCQAIREGDPIQALTILKEHTAQSVDPSNLGDREKEKRDRRVTSLLNEINRSNLEVGSPQNVDYLLNNKNSFLEISRAASAHIKEVYPEIEVDSKIEIEANILGTKLFKRVIERYATNGITFFTHADQMAFLINSFTEAMGTDYSSTVYPVMSRDPNPYLQLPTDQLIDPHHFYEELPGYYLDRPVFIATLKKNHLASLNEVEVPQKTIPHYKAA